MVTFQPASLFYAEEAEVETRDVDDDVSLFRSTCEDIQKIIKDVRSLKDENRKEMSPKVVRNQYLKTFAGNCHFCVILKNES